MDSIGTIELSGMEFHAFHGCFPEERLNGNTFIVDFSGEAPLGKAAESDNLEDTVDYGKLYDLIEAEMAIPSDLLEHVCGRIVEAIASDFPAFVRFKVTVSKKNPPVKGACAWSRVTLTHGHSPAGADFPSAG